MTDWKYTLSEPDLGKEEEAEVLDCIRSGWLSTGPRTKRLEERFAELHQVKHAVAVTNGTAALHLAYLALRLHEQPGAEIIQPSLTFSASANMTRAIGCVPVFGDIVDHVEPTLDPVEVERLITPQTKAVVAMHFGGYPAKMAELVELCKKHDLLLIEDACHAPLQTYEPIEGAYLGGIGDVGCFSFFSNKNLTCGEGGMVITNDSDIADRVRNLRSHGMTSLAWERHQSKLGTYDVIESGFNYRMDDLRAGLANVQLNKLDRLQHKRRHLAGIYARKFAQAPSGIRFVCSHMVQQGTAHVSTILVDPAIRDAMRKELSARGIQTSLHYPPVHEFTAYEDDASKLPKTEHFARSVITLPMHPNLAEHGVEEIADACIDIQQTLSALNADELYAIAS